MPCPAVRAARSRRSKSDHRRPKELNWAEMQSQNQCFFVNTSIATGVPLVLEPFEPLRARMSCFKSGNYWGSSRGTECLFTTFSPLNASAYNGMTAAGLVAVGGAARRHRRHAPRAALPATRQEASRAVRSRVRRGALHRTRAHRRVSCTWVLRLLSVLRLRYDY